MKALLLVPYFNKDGVGEDYSNFKFIEGIAQNHAVTVLTIARPGHRDRLPGSNACLVEFEDSPVHLGLVRRSRLYEKFSQQACPNYALYYRAARQWIERNAAGFDLIHQFSPLAMRYPTPALRFLARSPMPFVMGPLAGALPTPRAFRRHPWLPELRRIDHLRFRWDPWLRRTYRRASCLIGAAPYVRDHLGRIPLRRFEVLSEMGLDRTFPRSTSAAGPEALRLLFVGRLVPTKGALHAIRALALLPDLPGVTLDLVGSGELASECERLVGALDLRGRVRLLGRLSRDEVFEHYKTSDVFVFPSYREPTGHVVYEAMSCGLPVITTRIGGPAFIVTPECGTLLEPSSPAALERALAAEIRRLHADRRLLADMSRAAVERIEDVALWPRKIAALSAIYEQCLADSAAEPRDRSSP